MRLDQKARTICILILVVASLLVSNSSLYDIFGQPVLNVSPTCGPSKSGFNIQANASGFEPNAQINWKLNSLKNKTPTYGYFQSNSTGGFNESVFVGDLKDGQYKLYFGSGSNVSSFIDGNSSFAYANISMPCPS
jgi:hypothetical protein